MEVYDQQLGTSGNVSSEYIESSFGLQTALMNVLIKNNTYWAEAPRIAEAGTLRTLEA